MFILFGKVLKFMYLPIIFIRGDLFQSLLLLPANTKFALFMVVWLWPGVCKWYVCSSRKENVATLVVGISCFRVRRDWGTFRNE